VTDAEYAETRQTVRAIVDRIDQAWRDEGRVPPDVLCRRAQYTNLRGEYFRGRDAIADGTARVKAERQAEILERSIMDAEEIAPGVIVANVASRARMLSPDGPQEVRGRQCYVIVREDGEWRIAVYYNTPLRV
jgi:uncharacterized protein (TIGR02246 family)